MKPFLKQTSTVLIPVDRRGPEHIANKHVISIKTIQASPTAEKFAWEDIHPKQQSLS
jgi:hypothetical protein